MGSQGGKRPATHQVDDTGLALHKGAGGDDEDREKEISKLLNYHFDLEILHKWREVQVIQEELERGRQLRTLVEKVIMNEYVYGGGEGIVRAASAFTPGSGTMGAMGGPRRAESVGPPLRRAAARQASSSFSSGALGSSSSGTGVGGGKDRVQNEPHSQYEVRPDGTIVRMRCPKCGAEQFRSMLGFLNHCRIHCRLTFSSQDERLQRCGVVINPSEVPADYFQKHPSQLKQEMDLALIRADVLGPVSDTGKKPMIRTSDESFHRHLDSPCSTDALLAKDASHPKTQESRFYVKRRIVIGNAAKCLTASNNPATDIGEDELPAMRTEGKLPTHRWKIFVRSPRQMADPSEDVGCFIKGIRVFLHPSYRPNDVVDVTTAPFELSRPSWGEFPVRLQIHFWDPKNKPLEIVHFVRVLTVNSGKFTTVAEIVHEIDLDRRTDFSYGWTLRKTGLSTQISLPAVTAPITQNDNFSDEDVLLITINDFPLAGKRSKRAALAKYRPVSSMEEFLRFDIADQRHQEWKRANALCQHLMSSFPSFSMTTEQIIDWCRGKGYTPASVATFVNALEKSGATSAEQLLYCRFCGLPHLPQDKFDVLQKYCSLRPRKVHVSSRTSAQELLGRFEMHADGSEVVKRQRQEYFSPNYYLSPTPSLGEQKMFPVPSQGAVLEPSDESFLLDSWVETELDTFPQPKAYEPLAINVMMRAMKCFLRKLILATFREIPESKERTEDMTVLLTTLHLYRVVTTQSCFDFLSNSYMLGGGGSTSGGGGGGSGASRGEATTVEDSPLDKTHGG